jgi:hypothetical protein
LFVVFVVDVVGWSFAAVDASDGSAEMKIMKKQERAKVGEMDRRRDGCLAWCV